ncbi:CAZyme family GH76 [Purpureocillium lilacinum]|uniref:mannan endo-1,6-alpha-mannosidase n=1 Tax=Purpureocillium lilacinum TaxID=33203 RepID=A0ABR0BKD6_PURLI|nr:CAZyme family GH76 [Purpureocillium lilacinum]
MRRSEWVGRRGYLAGQNSQKYDRSPVLLPPSLSLHGIAANGALPQKPFGSTPKTARFKCGNKPAHNVGQQKRNHDAERHARSGWSATGSGQSTRPKALDATIVLQKDLGLHKPPRHKAAGSLHASRSSWPERAWHGSTDGSSQTAGNPAGLVQARPLHPEPRQRACATTRSPAASSRGAGPPPKSLAASGGQGTHVSQFSSSVHRAPAELPSPTFHPSWLDSGASPPPADLELGLVGKMDGHDYPEGGHAGDGDGERAVPLQGFEFTFDLPFTSGNSIEAEERHSIPIRKRAELSGRIRPHIPCVPSWLYELHEFATVSLADQIVQAYAFPNDAPEQERLALQGECIKRVLGDRLYFAPLSPSRPPLRILDIATGVGDWAIDMGDLFPGSTIIATDLSPIQPENVPPNVYFYVEDSTDPWDFTHQFDYIHTRSTVGCWASFETQIAEQAFQALEPGGWFESQEVDSIVCCDDGTLTPDNPVAVLFNDLVEAAGKLDRPAILGATLKEVYERVGFVDVQQRGIKMPIGGWARDMRLKEIGLMWRANLLEGLAGFSYQLLNRAFDRTVEEINVSLIEALMEAAGLTAQADSIRNVAATIAYDAMGYYKGNVSKNEVDVGDVQKPYYWWVAGALWGAMLDYYYYTRDPTYNDVVLQALLAPVNMGANHDYTPKARELEEGNDDLFFWGSAVLSAAERNFPQPNTSLPSWLDLGANIFNALVSRWDPSTCGGGLRWQIYASNPNGLSYKNSVSNGGFFQLAARMARATNNNTYLDWANRLWNWSSDVGFIDPDRFHVYDGADSRDNCSQTNYHSFTYTSGIYLYGAAILADHTGDQLWKTRTENLLRGAGWFFSPFENATNVMYEAACEKNNACTADMTTFKGYLSRFIWQTVKLVPSLRSEAEKWLLPSAKAAAVSCSGGVDGHTCGQRWYVHGFDGIAGLGEQMCALETIQGLLIDDVDPPLKGDKIKVIRDTKWVPLGAATTTSKGHDEPTSTGDPQPTETEDSANVATAHFGLVLVSIATILFIF